MEVSTISKRQHFFAKLAAILFLCTSEAIHGASLSTLATCKVDHPCSPYMVLFTNEFNKVLTFNGNRVSLKDSTRYPISVYDLMFTKSVSTSGADQKRPNWKTLGDNYIAVNSEGHLTLEEENSTQFLKNTIYRDNHNHYEKFTICAIRGNNSYLVPARKHANPKKWNADSCKNERSFQRELNKLNSINLEPFTFMGVSMTKTDFEAVDVSLSYELSNLCMTRCKNSKFIIEFDRD
jgi:hypothetical protein